MKLDGARPDPKRSASARAGGMATLAKHGPAHYSRISKGRPTKTQQVEQGSTWEQWQGRGKRRRNGNRASSSPAAA